jgi:hypothetical protein
VLQHASRRMSVAVQARVSMALSPQRDAPSRTAVLSIGSIQNRKRGKALTTGNSQSAHQAARVISSTTWFERRCRSHAVARSGASPRRLMYRKNSDTKGNSKIATERAGMMCRFNRDTARRSDCGRRSVLRTCRNPLLRYPYPPRAETTLRRPTLASRANLDYLFCPCL